MKSLSLSNLHTEAVFIMILIVSANFLAETFPCKIQALLRDNMITKHLFGFLTMMFFVVVSLPVHAPTNILEITVNSILLYGLFLLVSKTHSVIFMSLIVLFGVQYILQLRIKELNSLPNEEQLKWKEMTEMLEKITSVLKIVSIVLTIVGLLAYMGEKKIEYKTKFRYDYFFLGKPSCKGSSPKLNIFKSISQSFN